MSGWVEMITDEDASEELLKVLSLARAPHCTIDTVMRVHSLRPNTMCGRVYLYRSALYENTNTMPMWLHETIASYVSHIHECP